MSARIEQSTASVSSLAEKVAKVQESADALQKKTDEIEKKADAFQDKAFQSPPPVAISKSSSGGSSGGSRSSPLAMLGQPAAGRKRGARGPPSAMEAWFCKTVKGMPTPSDAEMKADPALWCAPASVVSLQHQLQQCDSPTYVRAHAVRSLAIYRRQVEDLRGVGVVAQSGLFKKCHRSVYEDEFGCCPYFVQVYER
jgi:hypothetical protein